MTYTLNDAQLMARANPGKFQAPDQADLDALKPGDLVKLCFRIGPPDRDCASAERMWVMIESVDGERLSGRLDNEPYDMPGLNAGSHVDFKKRHIYQTC